MSSLATNVVACLMIVPIGIRRMVCSISLYLNNPSQFRSRVWYFSHPYACCRNLDFYTLFLLLPLASLSHLFFFLAFSGHPTFKFSFLHHSLLLFFFWVVLVLVHFKDRLEQFGISESFVYVFAGVGFLIEYFVKGRGLVGVGAMVYGILGGLELVCAGCCLYLAFWPAAFFAEFLFSSALVLKGTWVLQAALSLYTDEFGFRGCDKVVVLPEAGESDVKCGLEMDKLRGMALMNFVFILHTMAVMVFGFVVLGVLYRNRSIRYGETSGSVLPETGLGRVQMIPSVAEFEIE